jgi:hypothetical protein
MIMFYTPEERPVNVALFALRSRAKATWFDPRTGESHAANGTTSGPSIWQFIPPGKGDWLLVLDQIQ